MSKIKLSICNYIAGSGKDSVSDYLCEKHGFKKYSFSEKIYEVAHSVYGIPIGTKPPRKLLHHIGESLRDYDKLLWINATMKKIEEDGFDRVIITDTRKLLEMAYLEEHGFHNVMVYCDPKIAMERLKARDGDGIDESLVMNSTLENQLRIFKDEIKTIDNSGAYEETLKEIDAFVDFLENKSKDID